MFRREFIKTGCALCTGLILPKIVSSGCSTIPVLKRNSESGKIMVDKKTLLSDQKLHIIRNIKMDFDLLLIEKEKVFHALYMECSHQSQPLAVNSKKVFCPAHGSNFDLDGNPTHGPADKPLRRFPVSNEKEFLVIHLS